MFAMWQHKTKRLAAISSCMFLLVCRVPSLPFLWGQKPPSFWRNAFLDPQVHLLNGYMNVSDDRQTDDATEKCVGIGGVASVAKAIPYTLCLKKTRTPATFYTNSNSPGSIAIDFDKNNC